MATIMMIFSIVWAEDVVTPVLIAFGTSFLCWIIVNVILSPRLKIDDKIQHGKSNKKYLRVQNMHWLMNAYDVECYVEYYRPIDTTQPYYTISHEPRPILRNRGPFIVFQINEDDKTKECFEQQGRIKLIISYQNCFGIKHSEQSDYIQLTELR